MVGRASLLLALALYTAAAGSQTAPVVELATTEWQPYIGEDLPGKGYVYQLVRAAFERAGYRAEIRFYPWARALALAREGAVAGLLPEYYDPQRSGEFLYSQAFPGGPVGFAARKDRSWSLPAGLATQPARAFAQMRGLRFGVVRGYLNAPAFDAAKDLQKEAAKNDLTNLRKLIHRRVDLIVIDDRVLQHLLRTELARNAAEVEFLQPPLLEQSLYVAFSRRARDYAALAAAFNRGLDALARSGELKAIVHGGTVPKSR